MRALRSLVTQRRNLNSINTLSGANLQIALSRASLNTTAASSIEYSENVSGQLNEDKN